MRAASHVQVQKKLAEVQQQMRTQKMISADETAALQGRLQEAANSSRLMADVCQQRVQQVEKELEVRAKSL